MDSIKKIAKMDMGTRFSLLWIFAMFNYLYADIVTLMDPSKLSEFMTGSVGGIELTQGFLLGGSILMETAIAMVLFSRILNYKANRWANIIVGIIHTLAVSASMFVGSGPALYYIFFATIEIITTLLIIWFAWNWQSPEA